MFNIDDPDRFQKVAAGIQSLLISAALLIGGAWTLYVFNSQLQIENSRAQLTKLNRELEAYSRLELEIVVQPMTSTKAATSRYFECRLVVRNVGARSTSLAFDDKPVRLYRVDIDNQGQPIWNLVRSINITMSEKPED